jgi:uncharacterized membrane protein YoaK (UPF0700 family)
MSARCCSGASRPMWPRRAARTLPAIVGFTVGCGLGAASEAALGTWSLALPAGLALLAFAMGFAAEPDDGPH